MMALDSVCGQPVDEGAATAAHLAVEHHGRTYYFCSEKCRSEFLSAPDRYAQPGTEISPDAERLRNERPIPPETA